MQKGKKKNFIVEMLTVQLVIYVNIDAILKAIYAGEKTFNSIKKTFR